ncbi:Non-catalytic module family DOC2, partial [Piromyces sp. E2]
CWSEAYGYKCCQCKTYPIIYDVEGSWGAENGEWCGIPKNCPGNECPGAIYGYKCCETCDSIFTDFIGKWGAINGEWCSVKSNC